MSEEAERSPGSELFTGGQAELRATLEYVKDGIFFADAQGVVRDANSAACLQLGRTRAEVIGSNVASIAGRAGFQFASVVSRLAVEEHLSYETTHIAKDGRAITVDLTITRVPHHGSFLYMGIARDVTERHAREEELRVKNDELTRFTYTVSHDLKSPLVTIQSFLGFLLEDARRGDAERVARDVEFIKTAADRMAALLTDLLQLSRMGRTLNPPERLPLAAVVDEALAMIAGRVAAQKPTIVVTQEPVTLLGDRLRLVEVFQNLLDNAVKFSGNSAAPRVEVVAEQVGDEVVLSVRDNGMGIDTRHQHKLFGLFEKLHPDMEGTGIGLALVKRIIDVHGGRIWIESAGPGLGTTVSFTLPGTNREGT